jgi:hypothetical protein
LYAGACAAGDVDELARTVGVLGVDASGTSSLVCVASARGAAVPLLAESINAPMNPLRRTGVGPPSVPVRAALHRNSGAR